MIVIQQTLRVLADGPEVEGIRLIVPQKLEQGDIAVREIDVAERFRGHETGWWENYLGNEIGGEWKVRRDGEFLQLHVPLRQLLDAMGRASWLKDGVDPEAVNKENFSLELPEDDPISEFRRRILTQAIDNLRVFVFPEIRKYKESANALAPPDWIRKCFKVINVMKPEIREPGDLDFFPMVLVKLGLIEIPMQQRIHHAPTTEFNPAVKLHNSVMRSASAIQFGERLYPEMDKDQFSHLLATFPLEKLGNGDDLRRLANSTLRLAIELPQLVHETRLPRVMALLHDNARSLNGLWNDSRLIVPEEEEASRIRLYLLTVRQRLMVEVLSCLANLVNGYGY